MKCPRCSTLESKVKKTIIQVEERGFSFGELKQRRRQCINCRRFFSTYEIHEDLFRKLQEALGRSSAAATTALREALKEMTAATDRQLKNQPGRSPLDFRRSIDE